MRAGFLKLALGLACCLGGILRAERPPSPFDITATLGTNTQAPVVRFEFLVPPDHHIYASRLHYEYEDGTALAPANPSEAEKGPIAPDKMYHESFAREFKLEGALPTNLVVRFQGCSNTACYFPEKRIFRVTSQGITRLNAVQPPAAEGGEASPIAAAQDWRARLDSFRLVSRQTGFMPAAPFLGFLEDAKAGRGLEESPLARLKELGLGVTLLLIFLGGIGLNLTPCVLPLIPINLAIIGAGSGARSRRLGFALGGIYGAGMALAYGALGLVVVLTGSKFGTLNSTISFNVLVAVLFVVLALGMFDLVNINFSRFRTRRSATAAASARGQMVVAFSMGTVAALLAGACVAPVVISVLLLSTQLYGQGHVAGLLLPFLLGLGMALPWPFAGAGLTFLPKPGRWMKWTKYAFGSLILAFAGYYAHLAFDLSRSQPGVTALATPHPGVNLQAATADEVLAQALIRGQSEHRPVFVDFAASWCKNCVAMDEAVLGSAEVQRRLKDFVVVRYQAERPNESPAREVLDRFGVIGLPTYVVLLPNP